MRLSISNTQGQDIHGLSKYKAEIFLPFLSVIFKHLDFVARNLYPCRLIKRTLLMARIEYSKNGNSPLQRLLGHNHEVLKKWDLLLDAFYQFSNFDPQLQEEVRRT